jgi:Putative sugar-binding domain
MLSDQKCYENKLSFMSSSPSIIRLNLNNLINKAIDLHVKDGNIVGIGSGSTIVYAVQRLRQRVLQENIQVKCVPTSFQVSGMFELLFTFTVPHEIF